MATRRNPYPVERLRVRARKTPGVPIQRQGGGPVAVLRRGLLLAAASLSISGTAVAAPSDQYVTHNLASSNTALIPADLEDARLINPWGLAASAGSPWWPVNQGNNTSTIINAAGTPNTTTFANVPSPTGGGAGAGARHFLIPAGGPAAHLLFPPQGGRP